MTNKNLSYWRKLVSRKSIEVSESPDAVRVYPSEDKGWYDRASIFPLSITIFFLICAFNLYEYVLRVFPSVMVTEIMNTYSINATSLGRLSAYFYFIYAPMQIWVGILVDRYGPHYLLPLAVFICALGVFLFADARFIWVAEIGRALMGFGAAFAFVGGLKFLLNNFVERRFGFLMGLMVSFCLLGGILGEIVLAFLLKTFYWRLICYALAAFGAVLFFLMLSLMYLQKSILSEKNSGATWKTVLLGFRDILKNRNIWLSVVIGCLFYLPTSVFAELWGISYFKVMYGFSNVESAYIVSMVFLGWAIGCPLMGWLLDHLQKPKILLILGAVISFILIFILLLIPQTLKVYLPFIMLGLGFFGSTQMFVIAIVRSQVPLKNVSTAISFLNMFVLMGGFLFQPLIGLSLDKFWDGAFINGVRFYSGNDYRIALMVLPIALLLGILLSLVIKFPSSKSE